MLATLSATVAISAVRSADAGSGTGCCHVDTDSNACTPRAYEPSGSLSGGSNASPADHARGGHAPCLACIDLRDGAFDPLHGCADV
jgi:hypothetical protein